MNLLAWFRPTPTSPTAPEQRVNALQTEVASYGVILRAQRERIDRQARIIAAEIRNHEATKRLLADEQASHQADVERLDAWWSARQADLIFPQGTRAVKPKAAKAKRRRR